MKNFMRPLVLSIVGMGCLVALSGTALASNLTLNWLDMSPIPFGVSVPNNSVYNLPGVGNVLVTYSIPTSFTDARFQNALLLNGNVVNGPNTYSWTGHELFATTNNAPPTPQIGASWRITYTFPGVQPPGSIFLGISGLGQTTSFGGGASTATVSQNGTFLGDWTGGGNYGPTQFTAGPPFVLQNSVTGAGGIDPWWNSALGVVRIDDPISSLTIDFNQLSGDGVGVNIASVVPEPASIGLVCLGGLGLLMRRRR